MEQVTLVREQQALSAHLEKERIKVVDVEGKLQTLQHTLSALQKASDAEVATTTERKDHMMTRATTLESQRDDLNSQLACMSEIAASFRSQCALDAAVKSKLASEVEELRCEVVATSDAAAVVKVRLTASDEAAGHARSRAESAEMAREALEADLVSVHDQLTLLEAAEFQTRYASERALEEHEKLTASLRASLLDAQNVVLRAQDVDCGVPCTELPADLVASFDAERADLEGKATHFAEIAEASVAAAAAAALASERESASVAALTEEATRRALRITKTAVGVALIPSRIWKLRSIRVGYFGLIMGGVNHCSLHCRLAKIRGLMRRVKYGDVIGQITHYFVCAQSEFPGYSLHCRLAKFHGLMIEGKHGAVIGRKTHYSVCAQ
jgi:uncharacterized protein YoxC